MPGAVSERKEIWSELEVLWAEYAELHVDPAAPAPPPPPPGFAPLWWRIHELPGDGRTALCLSGGGIRSAAFNLGLIQGLARLGLLDRFHYLSTVSGGGYIGGWLSAWRHHAGNGLADVLAGLSWPDYAAGPGAPPPAQPPPALEGLRQGTSFLTPRTGALSPDTWTAIVLSVRNLLLHYLVLVPLFVALLFLPKLMLAVAVLWPLRAWSLPEWAAGEVRGDIALLSLAVAAAWALATLHRPSWLRREPPPAVLSNRPQRVAIALLLVAAVAFALSLAGSYQAYTVELKIALWGTCLGFLAFTAAVFLSGAHHAAGPGGRVQTAVLGFVAFGWVAAGALGAARLAEFWQASGWLAAILTVLSMALVVEASRYDRRGWDLALLAIPAAALWHYVVVVASRHGSHPGGSFFGAALVLILVVWFLVVWLWRAQREPPSPNKFVVREAPQWAVLLLGIAAAAAGAAAGVCLAFGLWLVDRLPAQGALGSAIVLSFAPLWIVLAYQIADAVYLGATVRRPPVQSPSGVLSFWSDPWGDEEREWVARSAAYAALYGAAIGAVLFLALVGPLFWEWLFALPSGAPIAAFIVVGLGLASVGLGASPLSTAARMAAGAAARLTRIPIRLTLLAATPLFMAALISLGSYLVDQLFLPRPLLTLLEDCPPASAPTFFDPRSWRGIGMLALVGLGIAAVGLVAAAFVNINRFSLHDIYRQRLIREFLGAAHLAVTDADVEPDQQQPRNPDPWSGIDVNDDLPLADLWRPRHDDRRCLYPVINAALNMVGTNRLDWQERKARSFVFTPRYAGAAGEGLGFRPTGLYGGGVLLGSAMTVSGAAVSPNAGYNTTPGLAFLLTLFNLRLGAWVGNPGPPGSRTYGQRGPRYALGPLVSEALARTTDRTRYVYLSDGGHFDNLGLYEMLRRRCRFILISDATADPRYAYADLGSVVRKAAIDFGIRVSFEFLDLRRAAERGTGKAYCAFGAIEYPEMLAVPGAGAKRQRGYLLYIKPGYRGQDEPADVGAYALANPAFPHDTTMNQFFAEAQFESYRALGSFIMSELARQAGFAASNPPPSLTRFFDRVRHHLRSR